MRWRSIIQKVFNKFGFEIHEKVDFERVKLFQRRNFLSNMYLSGNGIEIGALNRPLEVPNSANVKYIDRKSFDELKIEYPEVGNNIIKPDIIDDGELLSKFMDNSLDFIIANHLIEHSKNPIGAIENMLRVLKPKGILYMAVPDKRLTFDKNRPITPIEHLLEVYKNGKDNFLNEHYEEWVKIIDQIEDKAEFKERVKHLISIDYSIHIHVWTSNEIIELITTLRKVLHFKLELEASIKNSNEVILILRKTD